MALVYRPSTVLTRPFAKRWSYAAEIFWYCGKRNFGSIVLTAEPADGPTIVAPGIVLPANVPLAHVVGGLVMFAALNVGTNSDVFELAVSAAPLHVSATKPLEPELPNALERYTYGGGPLK